MNPAVQCYISRWLSSHGLDGEEQGTFYRVSIALTCREFEVPKAEIALKRITDAES